MEDLVTFSVVVGSGPEAVGFVLQLSVEQLKLGEVSTNISNNTCTSNGLRLH